MEPTHLHLLDIRSAIEPITLLKVTQTFSAMRTGEALEILVDDEDTRRDLLKVLPSSGYELITVKEEDSFLRILLKKNR